VILFFGPRIALFLGWLFADWYDAFDSRLIALLGFLLMPWTSLAWMYTYFHHQGTIDGGYVVLLILGALGDMSAIGGGASSARRRHDEGEG
jgi:hypothetical protein